MAAQLQKTFNAETSLIKGGGGDFDVYVDSVLIFSKKKEGRFPNEGEVERLIKNLELTWFSLLKICFDRGPEFALQIFVTLLFSCFTLKPFCNRRFGVELPFFQFLE